jgi:UDP-N-acetylglucosamine acyltransferase
MSFIGGYSKLLKDVPPYFMIQGNPGSVRGLNVEGMKRRGVAREAVNELKEAYRQLYRSEDRRSAVLDQLRRTLATSEGKELVDFFAHPTDRGIVTRPAVKRRRTSNGQAEATIDTFDES